MRKSVLHRGNDTRVMPEISSWHGARASSDALKLPAVVVVMVDQAMTGTG
jgi:hypothetical protein